MNTGDDINAENANWQFSGDTAKHFDEHIRKSVPIYDEGHDIICNIADYFLQSNSCAYELGSATGELTLKLAGKNSHKAAIKFVGIDCEMDMINEAKRKQDESTFSNVQFVHDDILTYDFSGADLIIAYYTIQFIRPRDRQKLIDKIYKSLNWGGCFLMFEKVRAPDARFQDMMTGIYNEYKVQQGYKSDEIMAKSNSLKGVLEPFSTQGNIDLLKRAGFVDYMSVSKYICFEGFMAIK
ncbi:MAG: methyltransferase domain-containing protein [Lentisphaeria bacterium]|nr:methyltransferase domain-containing protein [Lentisphaeria bacterium]NQZ69603.1 methyltransferase domain-containing protein [Lentisphaeria bacterium]